MRFVDPSRGIDVSRTVAATTAISDAAVAVDWDAAERVNVLPDTLEKEPAAAVTFGELPSAATRAKNYDAWSKQFVSWLTVNETLDLFRSASSGELSKPGESEREFRTRLQLAGREERDRTVEALRKKYAPKQAVLDDRLRRAQQTVQRESQQASSQKIQTAISVGATLVSAFLGRKTVSLSSLGRATTAARGVGRTMKESEDIHRAQESVAAIEEQRRQLDEEFKAETATLEAATDPTSEKLERIAVKPKKTNIAVKLVTLVWMP